MTTMMRELMMMMMMMMMMMIDDDDPQVFLSLALSLALDTHVRGTPINGLCGRDWP